MYWEEGEEVVGGWGRVVYQEVVLGAWLRHEEEAKKHIMEEVDRQLERDSREQNEVVGEAAGWGEGWAWVVLDCLNQSLAPCRQKQ